MGVLFIRVPYYIGDFKRDPTLGTTHLVGLLLGLSGFEAQGLMLDELQLLASGFGI